MCRMGRKLQFVGGLEYNPELENKVAEFVRSAPCCLLWYQGASILHLRSSAQCCERCIDACQNKVGHVLDKENIETGKIFALADITQNEEKNLITLSRQHADKLYISCTYLGFLLAEKACSLDCAAWDYWAGVYIQRLLRSLVPSGSRENNPKGAVSWVRCPIKKKDFTVWQWTFISQKVPEEFEHKLVEFIICDAPRWRKLEMLTIHQVRFDMLSNAETEENTKQVKLVVMGNEYCGSW